MRLPFFEAMSDIGPQKPVTICDKPQSHPLWQAFMRTNW